MKSLKNLCGVIVVCSLLFGACGDEELLKFGNIEEIKNWKPSFALPVASATYTVWGLVEQNDPDANIVLKEDKIVIRYQEDSIYTFDVKKVIDLPETVATLTARVPMGSIPGGVVIPDEGIDIRFPESGYQEENIEFEDGTIDRIEGNVICSYVLPAMGFTYRVKLTLENVKTDGAPVVQDFIVGLDGKTGEWELDEVVFDMAAQANKIKWNVLISVDGGQTIANAGDLLLAFELKDVRFTRLEGGIDPRVIDIDPGEFNLDIDFWNNFNGEFGFNDAKIEMTVTNYGLKVPMSVNMAFTAYGDGKVKEFAGDPLVFSGWNNGNEAHKETLGYDKSNSNINDVLSLPPKDKITYGGAITINPGNGKVVVLGDGNANVDAYIEIPLDLKAKNLVFNDTIDVDLNEKLSDKILEAAIRVKAENGVPLELKDGNLLLLDANHACMDSVKVDRFIDAPVVGNNGEVTVAESNNLIRLTPDNISHIDGMKYIVIQVKAATSNNGDVPVQIKPDATIKLNLILEVRFDGDKL